MNSINFTIKGVTPLICNKFTDKAALAATAHTRSSVLGEDETPKEQAESKVYTNGTSAPIFPQPNIFSAIVEAGKWFKMGKSKVTTLKTSIIPACIFINNLYSPIKSKEGWTVDTRPVRNPSTGGRFLVHRPIWNDWELSWETEYDPEIIGEKLYRQIIDAMCNRVGLGDFRPQCKGPFGRSVVTSWKEVKKK